MSQANFDTLIITSPPSIFLSNTHSSSSWPPCSSHTRGRAKHHCQNFLSRAGLPRTKVVQVRGQNRATDRPLTPIRGLLSSKEHIEASSLRMLLPSTFPDFFPLLVLVLSLYVSQASPPSPHSISGQCRAHLQLTEQHSRSRIKRGEGSRCLWQCGGSNEGLYGRRKKSSGHEHTDDSHAHIRKTARE